MSRDESGKYPQPTSHWSLPITAILLVGFGGLVAVAVASVMLISIRVAQENTDQLLQQNASQRLDAAIGRIDRYLEPVAEDVGFLAHQLSREGDLSPAGDPQIESLTRIPGRHLPRRWGWSSDGRIYGAARAPRARARSHRR